MAKLNWNPWMGLSEVKAEVDRVMNQALSGRAADHGLPGKAYFWTPCADVLETAEAFVVTVELPGVEREDVAVEVKAKTLWVYGERRLEKPCESEGVFHALERSHGPFARRFTLAKGVDRQAVSAILRSGVLEITIPKERREARRRRIPIL